jgi:hypothetical protein
LSPLQGKVPYSDRQRRGQRPESLLQQSLPESVIKVHPLGERRGTATVELAVLLPYFFFFSGSPRVESLEQGDSGTVKEHRKRIWIHPFQTGLLLRIAVYCLVFQLFAWAFFALCEQINAGFTALGAESPLLSSTFVRTVLTFLILVPPLTLEAVRFAHRLVGPLYRFRQTIQAIAAGEPVALVQLRKGDLLVDFKDDFNVMLKYLEQQGYVLLKAPGEPVNAETPQAVGSLAPAAPGGQPA